ncbi:imm11 family protein [Flavobacterium aquiphilum]|uniref:imm11 family protein n=1 Tax=Flavobacterium aquiphilum TaxID=3003261 RepID=UPI0024805A3C|nr:DUF1629 domain-containing protein [Flavobacterium aquiphilum]
MKEYFFLADKVKRGTAFAYTEDETPLSHELVPELKTKLELPFDLILKKVVFGKAKLQVSNDLSDLKYLWLDYQPNNLAWPLMSEKMKNVVCDNMTGEEAIVWMKVNVKSEKEKRVYFIPRFEKKMDVLDEQKTIFAQGTKHIVKPVFSYEKIMNYNIFHKPQLFWEITSGIYVSEVIKKAIQKEKLTGVDFEEISVV